LLLRFFQRLHQLSILRAGEYDFENFILRHGCTLSGSSEH
jgi:hypothetical protein